MPPLSRKAKIILVVIVAIAVLAIAGVGFAVWYLRAKKTAPPSSSGGGGSTANYDATSDTWSGTFKVVMTPAMAGAYILYNWTESNTNSTGLTTVMTADDQSTNDAAALFTGAVTPGDQLTTSNNEQCSNSQTPVPASFSTLTVDASSPCVVLGYLP